MHPRSRHGHYPHLSSPSPFLPLVAITISTKAPKATLLHAWDPSRQAASAISLLIIRHRPRRLHRRHVCQRPGELRDFPCTPAVPPCVFLLCSPRRRGAGSPHQPPSPAPARWVHASATMTMTLSGYRRTAATTPLSTLLLAMKASSENGVRLEGGGKLGRRWSFGLGLEMGFWARPWYLWIWAWVGAPSPSLWTSKPFRLPNS